MHTYVIAGTKIKVECKNDYLLERLKPFCSAITEPADMYIKITQSDFMDMPDGDLLLDDQVLCIRKVTPDRGFYMVRYDKDQNLVKAILSTDEKWSDIDIRCLDIQWQKDIRFVDTLSASWLELYTFQLMGIAYRYHILLKDGIVIHSSSLSYDGKGILFTAPSGTGKSTHVGLWEEHFGKLVSVINDDTPVIRFIGEVPYVCGTPWSGSSDKFNNIEVPLNSIVVLEQSRENRIRKLTPHEALPMVLPRLFMPYFDRLLMENVYHILDKLLCTIPVYHLSCRPDKEAMEMSFQCIR